MSSAKRRINSTGRRRITRNCVEIRLFEPVPDEPLKAKVSLNLDNFNFPGSSLVALEAYHRSSGMRFDFGTVDALTIPPVLILSEVDRDGSVLFRLKVIDNDNEPGRLLGSAERIQPGSEEDQDGRRSIFPILFRDLDADVWKVEVECGDRPKLLINNRMQGFRHNLTTNPMLQGVIYPAALRFVMAELVRNAKTGDGDDDDDENWKEDWLSYSKAELGMTEDPRVLGDEDRVQWIDEAVKCFCKKYGFIKKIGIMTEEAG